MNDLITYYAVVPTTYRDWLKKLNNANDLYISIIEMVSGQFLHLLVISC